MGLGVLDTKTEQVPGELFGSYCRSEDMADNSNP